VSRSTVYVLYGSRAGLFDALGRHLRLEAGFDELIREFRRPDASRRCAGSQRAAVRMYAKMPELARAMFTMAAVDPDAVAAVRAIEDGRRPGQAQIAHRLAEQGYLREGVSVDEATDILTVITSFQAFDELFNGGGLPAGVVADRLVAMASARSAGPMSRVRASAAAPAASRPAEDLASSAVPPACRLQSRPSAASASSRSFTTSPSSHAGPGLGRADAGDRRRRDDRRSASRSARSTSPTATSHA
jgi:hypothetical protein